MSGVMRSLFVLADDGYASVPVDGRPPHTELLPRWSPEPGVRETGRQGLGGSPGDRPGDRPGERTEPGERTGPGEVARHAVAGDPESEREHPGGMHG